MVLNKKVIVWDLDNTLYVEAAEFKDMLDEATAIAAIKDLGLSIDFEEAKAKVAESYRIYRDGGEIFIREYGVSPEAIYKAYHKRKLEYTDAIVPYTDLCARLGKLQCEQYILSTSSREVCEKILKHIGLYEFFKDRFYSVEDFGVFKKNESKEIYKKFCEAIGVRPEDCYFVDDSYSNLEYAKEAGMTTVRIFYNVNSAKDKTYIDYAFKGIESFLDAAEPECMEFAAQ